MATLARFLDPPRLRTVESGQADRRATWLELFFDLVFVAAIAELGSIFGLHLTATGFLKFAALFVPVWWAWAGFAFYANRFDTGDLVYRLLVLLGMFAVAALATNVRGAFLHGASGFVLSYVGARVVLLVLYGRAIRFVPEARRLAIVYFVAFSAAVAVWLASLTVGSPARFVGWGLALAIELAAPFAGWRQIPRAPIDVTHIPERFGLLTIIVLGESVLAVVLGVRNVSWQLDAGLAAAGGFLAVAAIWWIYFEFLDSSMVSRGIVSGLVFTYAHFPVVVGIASLGVGVKYAILSSAPGDTYRAVGWVACVGTAVCMLGLAAIQLATPPTLFDADVWLRLAAAALAAVLAALSLGLSPILIVWLLAATLAAQVVIELAGHDSHGQAPQS